MYIRLLLGASRGEWDYKGVHLQWGQLIISQCEFAEKCGLSRQELRTILDRLTATHKIIRSLTQKYSLITPVECDCATQSAARSATTYQPTANPLSTHLHY